MCWYIGTFGMPSVHKGGAAALETCNSWRWSYEAMPEFVLFCLLTGAKLWHHPPLFRLPFFSVFSSFLRSVSGITLFSFLPYFSFFSFLPVMQAGSCCTLLQRCGASLLRPLNGLHCFPKLPPSWAIYSFSYLSVIAPL